MMRRLLLTGMSGVGKSAVLKRIERADTLCVELDDGWMLSENGEPVIDVRRAAAYIDANPAKHIVFAGCAINQRSLPVDIQILLTASPEVMKERILKRSNPFGKDETSFAKILADKEQFEPLIRAGSDLVIDTGQPLEQTVCAIRRILDDPS